MPPTARVGELKAPLTPRSSAVGEAQEWQYSGDDDWLRSLHCRLTFKGDLDRFLDLVEPEGAMVAAGLRQLP